MQCKKASYIEVSKYCNVFYLDSSAAAEEGDEEDDAADNDEEDRGVEELVAQKVQVLAEKFFSK
jgi:hypothetical protein